MRCHVFLRWHLSLRCLFLSADHTLSSVHQSISSQLLPPRKGIRRCGRCCGRSWSMQKHTPVKSTSARLVPDPGGVRCSLCCPVGHSPWSRATILPRPFLNGLKFRFFDLQLESRASVSRSHFSFSSQTPPDSKDIGQRQMAFIIIMMCRAFFHCVSQLRPSCVAASFFLSRQIGNGVKRARISLKIAVFILLFFCSFRFRSRLIGNE